MTINTIIRISEVLFQKYGYYIPISQIGYESHAFYRQEIDEQLVPNFVLEHLEEPFETENASYTDAEGNYYLIIQVDINEEPYKIWLVNDEVVRNFANM